jgi:hypothetical protein
MTAEVVKDVEEERRTKNEERGTRKMRTGGGDAGPVASSSFLVLRSSFFLDILDHLCGKKAAQLRSVT